MSLIAVLRQWDQARRQREDQRQRVRLRDRLKAGDAFDLDAALDRALGKGHMATANVLLKAGADPNALTRGLWSSKSIFEKALMKGDAGAVRLLAMHGADLRTHRGDCPDPLLIAIAKSKDDPAMVQVFIDADAPLRSSANQYGHGVDTITAATDWGFPQVANALKQGWQQQQERSRTEKEQAAQAAADAENAEVAARKKQSDILHRSGAPIGSSVAAAKRVRVLMRGNLTH